MVQKGEFREDLYYRLNVIQFHLPPLRERSGGIMLLAHYLLSRISQELGKKVTHFSRQAIESLDEYAWPGNVRELENVIRRAVVLAEGQVVELWHLPAKLREGVEEAAETRSYEEELRDFKRRLVVRTLQKCNGNKAEAARVLGLARGYLHRLIHDLKIQSEETAPTAVINHHVGSGNRSGLRQWIHCNLFEVGSAGQIRDTDSPAILPCYPDTNQNSDGGVGLFIPAPPVRWKPRHGRC